MKRDIQLLASLICIALGHASVQGATKYWDINGATPGAGGATPSGAWDTGTTANWTTSSGGTSTGTTWASEDDAVFSAGTDATGVFTVILNSSQTAGNLTVEEGALTIDFESGFYPYLDVGGSVAGKGIINIAAGLNTTINAPLAGGDDRGQLTKTGTGTLTLAGVNGMGTNVVAEGVVVAANNVALGDGSVPTIVSNGAALHLSGIRSMGESLILNGTNIAAFRGGAGIVTWSAPAELGSDARIDSGGGNLFWNNYRIVGNNVNLTLGGTGGQIRLNIPHPAVNVGTGTITKDGTSKLILDQPSYCSAFYFNGGTIYPRNESQYGGFGSGKIYVGGNACQFTADFMNVILPYDIVLAAGPTWGLTATKAIIGPQNGVISGQGGLSKTNSHPDFPDGSPGVTTGTLFLNNANTYSGNTTIRGGPLVLGANGSISNSAVIDVWSGGIFDVSAVTGGFVLQSAQTLKGNGAVLGNVMAKGTISPGASVGSLTFSNNLTLGGNLLIDVDKALSPSNDVITVIGTLTNAGSGAVTVANIGTNALAVGDAFYLFKADANNNKPLPNGQAMTVVGGGVTWTNKLAVDGSIAVASITPPPVIQAPRMTSVTVSGAPGVRVTWTNVMVGSNYWLQSNTNLNTANWTDLSPVTAWGTTAYQMEGLPAGARHRYYRVRFLTSGGPPATQPRITSVDFPGMTSVLVNYTNTVAGTNYVVQYRTNLNTTNWTSLSPVTASGTASTTTDRFPAGTPQRYYRVYGQF